MAVETLERLNEIYPARQKQIECLYNLFGTAGDPLPSSIYIYGDTATGKTQVVQGVLSMTSASFAIVNCIECYTPRLLLEPILDKLLNTENNKDVETENGDDSDTKEIDNSEDSNAEKCDNMMILVKQLRIAAKLGKLTDFSCVIVLDNCERLLDIGENYFLAFQKLQELTNLPNLSVVFISQILPEKFPVSVPYIRIFFPQYAKDDISKILYEIFSKEFEEILESKEEETLFKQFTTLFLDTFYLATRDLNELKQQLFTLYPRYVEPVKAGRIKPTDFHGLYKNIVPHFRASLNSVYLPGVSGNEEDSKLEKVLSNKVIRTLDLPYYAKYFLIAAFLASYNSPKDDKRLFVKNHGKKKKRLVQDQKKENASKEFVGPKIFTLDRLLAIFYAIMEEKTPLNANLLAQITTLVELRLLVKMGDDLDRPKYRCAVGIDCVEAISRTLDFNVRKYMVH